MKWAVVGFILLAGAAWAVEGTVWYDSSGQVAVVEGPAAKPLPEPFVPEWRKRELERRERQGAYRSSLYDDWHWRGYRGYRSRYYRHYGGWYGGYYGCYRPVPYRGFHGSYRSTSGRFTAVYRSGAGARVGVVFR